jgi:16S rRNA (guanine966-N2)-methyltransferase
MRITAGKYKGRTIKSPKAAGTHPMGEREKLALFNMVGNDFGGLVVLDAYAGSGALGLEALSRGVKKVVFVEKSPKVARVIKSNLQGIGEISPDSYTVICGDVKNLDLTERFDMVIADPPYDNFKVEDIANLAEFLNNDGVFVLSHPGEAPEITNLSLEKTKKYAGARLSVYTKKL